MCAKYLDGEGLKQILQKIRAETASQADLTALTNTVNTKASQADLNQVKDDLNIYIQLAESTDSASTSTKIINYLPNNFTLINKKVIEISFPNGNSATTVFLNTKGIIKPLLGEDLNWPAFYTVKVIYRATDGGYWEFLAKYPTLMENEKVNNIRKAISRLYGIVGDADLEEQAETVESLNYLVSKHLKTPKDGYICTTAYNIATKVVQGISDNFRAVNGTVINVNFTNKNLNTQTYIKVGIATEPIKDIKNSWWEAGDTVTLKYFTAEGGYWAIIDRYPSVDNIKQKVIDLLKDIRKIKKEIGNIPDNPPSSKGTIEDRLDVLENNAIPDSYIEALCKEIENYVLTGVELNITEPRLVIREPPIISLTDFNAIGDGIHDDTAAWNAFLDTYGGMKYIPAGDYLINGKHQINSNGIWYDMGSTESFNEVRIYALQQYFEDEAELDIDGRNASGPNKGHGECTVIKKNNLVIMIDTAGSNRATMTKNFLQAIGVDHVDYMIFSHYHYDHVSNFCGYSGNGHSSPFTLDDYLDLSNCKFYLPKTRKQLYDSLSQEIALDEEILYNSVLNKLSALGKTEGVDYFFPNELDAIQIDSTLRLTFFNAGLNALQEIYDYHIEDEPGIALRVNDCSMCCLLEHGNTTMFFTGDMMKYGEKRLFNHFNLYSRFEYSRKEPLVGYDIAENDQEFDEESLDDIDNEATSINLEVDNFANQYHPKSETIYEKILNVDLYKMGHHGINSVYRHAYWEYYKFLRPKYAYMVSPRNYFSLGDSSNLNSTNASNLKDTRIYNSYYEMLEFVSRGNGIEVVKGQEELYDLNGYNLRIGDTFAPYNGNNNGGTGNWISFIGIDLLVNNRQVNFLLYVSSTRTKYHVSAIYEVTIDAESNAPNTDNFDFTNTRIKTIYTNDTKDPFSQYLGLAYMGTDSNGKSHYEICVRKDKDNHIKITLLGFNRQPQGVECYRMYSVPYFQFIDENGEEQLFKQASIPYYKRVGKALEFLGVIPLNTLDSMDADTAYESFSSKKKVLTYLNLLPNLSDLNPADSNYESEVSSRINSTYNTLVSKKFTLIYLLKFYQEDSDGIVALVKASKPIQDFVENYIVDAENNIKYSNSVNNDVNIRGNILTEEEIYELSYANLRQLVSKTYKEIVNNAYKALALEYKDMQVTKHLLIAQTSELSAYSNGLPFYNNKQYIDDFDDLVKPGKYHVYFENETKHRPNIDLGGFSGLELEGTSEGKHIPVTVADGELIVEIIPIANIVAWTNRVTQFFIAHGPAVHTGRTFYRGRSRGDYTWSEWRELISDKPPIDNAMSFGSANYRWSEIFAASSEINTSDERQKDDITNINDALMRAWGKVNFKQFRYKDAIAKKGQENARYHIGLIAQRISEAFASEGLDASKYGLFCYDEWPEKKEEVEVLDKEAVIDEAGNVVIPAVTHKETQVIREAGSSYGIRYVEALALECAYQRWRLNKLEETLGGANNA